VRKSKANVHKALEHERARCALLVEKAGIQDNAIVQLKQEVEMLTAQLRVQDVKIDESRTRMMLERKLRVQGERESATTCSKVLILNTHINYFCEYCTILFLCKVHAYQMHLGCVVIEPVHSVTNMRSVLCVEHKTTFRPSEVCDRSALALFIVYSIDNLLSSIYKLFMHFRVGPKAACLSCVNLRSTHTSDNMGEAY
jgi:hypothetical protein